MLIYYWFLAHLRTHNITHLTIMGKILWRTILLTTTLLGATFSSYLRMPSWRFCKSLFLKTLISVFWKILNLVYTDITFLCRSEHFRELLENNFLNLTSFQPPFLPLGFWLANMIFLIRSEHFIQFIAKHIFEHDTSYPFPHLIGVVVGKHNFCFLCW